MRTRLARISGVHQYQFLAVPLAFVRQHGLDFRPGGIGNGTRQLTVLQKILGFQIFQDDQVVFFDQAGCVLLQIVVALIGNLFVDTRHLFLGFLDIFEIRKLQFDFLRFRLFDFDKRLLTAPGQFPFPLPFLFRQ